MLSSSFLSFFQTAGCYLPAFGLPDKLSNAVGPGGAQGRGTVVTGRVEQGIVRTGDEVEILGINEPLKTTVTGVEMFKKQLNEGQAGDNVGLLLRGIKRDDVVRGQVRR